MPDERDAAQFVAQHGHQEDPAHTPAHAERQETQVRHLAHAGDESRKGPHNRHEFRVDQRLPTVFFVESLGAPHILLFEESRIRPRENFRSGAIAEKISALIAQNRDDNQQRADFHDVQVARPAHHADRE